MSTQRRPRAILIAGPTASGKSAIAIAAAQAWGGVVINADSMQVYRELCVLTARPSQADEACVPHRLYGHVSVREPYSVARWLDQARAEISAAEAGGLLPVITGGTGLYFKALLEGLSPVPPIPEDVRAHWRAAGATWSAGELHAELKRADPQTAAQIRAGDRQRIVRALEVLTATGKPLVEWQAIGGSPALDAESVAKIVISRPREELYERCEIRFRRMIDEGALDEARLVGEMQLDPALPAARALGLSPLIAHVAGELLLEEAVAIAVRDTRHYIKRQLTWLRRYMIAWNWKTTQEMETQVATNFSNLYFGH
ncbi:MAG: tRNA (adenosine(37)-N6)-dimethylallyltransferase MiaA [Hyphomicrobiaceae bacterium]